MDLAIVKLAVGVWWPCEKISHDSLSSSLDDTEGNGELLRMQLLGCSQAVNVKRSSEGNTWAIVKDLSIADKVITQEIVPRDMVTSWKSALEIFRKRLMELHLVENGTSNQSSEEAVNASDQYQRSGSKRKIECSSSVDSKVSKRGGVLSWDDYFMAICWLSAMRSKDPSTQVGACIVNQDKRIVGIGYNGFPRGCSDDELPWDRSATVAYDTKYLYVCHAEVNAILNKNSTDVHGCTLYVDLFPCNDCAKVIIQSGICQVVYFSDKYKDTESMRASRRMFTMAKVAMRQHTPVHSSITIPNLPTQVSQLPEHTC